MRQTILIAVGFFALLTSGVPGSQAQGRFTELDKTVEAFLESHRGTWRDLNVPESDGRVLHDLILKHRYTRALEIGTSTGHSGVWIAWALAKTGGKLTTVEIDTANQGTTARYRAATFSTSPQACPYSISGPAAAPVGRIRNRRRSHRRIRTLPNALTANDHAMS